MNKEIENIVSVLTADEQQLLKDTINYGGWGYGACYANSLDNQIAYMPWAA